MTDSQMARHQADRLEMLEARLRRLEDIEAIRRLKAAYCACGDGGWPEHGPSHMGPFADLFVEDAVWDGRPIAAFAEGREAIHELVVLGSRPIPFVMHNVMNPEIDIAADGNTATGKWHVIAPLSRPDGSSHLIFGTYDERYVRTAQGWRFQSIRFVAARSGEPAAGWKAIHD